MAVKQENGYYVWNKGDHAHLSAHFQTSEFECRCKNEECAEQRISVELINRLEWLREAAKSSLRCHSGFRCAAKQEQIRKSGVSTVVAKVSTHEKGDAADVSTSAGTPKELLKLAAMKFKSIGIAVNFLHLDLRDDAVRRWNY